MSDRFQELSVFVRAADSGSFSAAARDLALSQPSVSRIVSELEARLGVRLLLRSTRRVALTEAGAAFLARARQVLHDLGEADQAARGADSLEGAIRIALSPLLCERVLLPGLGDFARAHPALKFEFLTSDGMHDLLAESADIALRFGPLADSPFGARKLAMLPRVVLAAPSYLRARGAPETPQQLADHDCIVGPNAASFQQWRFTDKSANDNAAHGVDIVPRYLFSSADGALACAREGLGIARAAAPLCRADIERGALVPLLTGYALAPVELHAVYPAGRAPSHKVRLFTDFLAQLFTAAP